MELFQRARSAAQHLTERRAQRSPPTLRLPLVRARGRPARIDLEAARGCEHLVGAVQHGRRSRSPLATPVFRLSIPTPRAARPRSDRTARGGPCATPADFDPRSPSRTSPGYATVCRSAPAPAALEPRAVPAPRTSRAAPAHAATSPLASAPAAAAARGRLGIGPATGRSGR